MEMLPFPTFQNWTSLKVDPEQRQLLPRILPKRAKLTEPKVTDVCGYDKNLS